MEVDLRTPSEKAREEKHERIVNMFLSLSAEQPDAAPHRIFLAIANNEHGCEANCRTRWTVPD